MKYIFRICEECEKQFELKDTKLNRNRRFCSGYCARSNSGKKNKGLRNFKFERIKVKLAMLSAMIKETSSRGIKHVIFLGYIRPIQLLKDIIFDEITRKAFIALKDKRPKALMESAINQFKKAGITTVPTTYLMDKVLASEGFVNNIKPQKSVLEALKCSVSIARSIAALDVGQTLVTGAGMIWAVEAMEGTDNCIKRGGKMAKKGFIVVKMARPKQDLRYDVPAIGEVVRSFLNTSIQSFSIFPVNPRRPAKRSGPWSQ